MGQKKRGKLFVISAPSGAGKTSLIAAAMNARSDTEFSTSHTTRQKREEEVDKQDYYFVDHKTFKKLIADGAFLEHAEVFGNYYGTTRAEAERILDKGHHAILEIDWQGAGQVRDLMPEAVAVFVLPPSREELVRRLKGRGTEDESSLARRLGDSVADMRHWKEFDYVIVNDDFDAAVDALTAVLDDRGEPYRRRRADVRPLIDMLLAKS